MGRGCSAGRSGDRSWATLPDAFQTLDGGGDLLQAEDLEGHSAQLVVLRPKRRQAIDEMARQVIEVANRGEDQRAVCDAHETIVAHGTGGLALLGLDHADEPDVGDSPHGQRDREGHSRRQQSLQLEGPELWIVGALAAVACMH